MVLLKDVPGIVIVSVTVVREETIGATNVTDRLPFAVVPVVIFSVPDDTAKFTETPELDGPAGVLSVVFTYMVCVLFDRIRTELLSETEPIMSATHHRARSSISHRIKVLQTLWVSTHGNSTFSPHNLSLTLQITFHS